MLTSRQTTRTLFLMKKIKELSFYLKDFFIFNCPTKARSYQQKNIEKFSELWHNSLTSAKSIYFSNYVHIKNLEVKIGKNFAG